MHSPVNRFQYTSHIHLASSSPRAIFFTNIYSEYQNGAFIHFSRIESAQVQERHPFESHYKSGNKNTASVSGIFMQKHEFYPIWESGTPVWNQIKVVLFSQSKGSIRAEDFLVSHHIMWIDTLRLLLTFFNCFRYFFDLWSLTRNLAETWVGGMQNS